MSTTLTISNSVNVGWTYENVLTWANSSNTSSFSYSRSFTNGTTANKCDLIYILQTTLAPSTTLNIDLASGITDIFGNTLLFARVKLIYLKHKTDTTSSGVTIGGHATTALANWISSADTLANDQPKITVRNGGTFYLCAPDATAYAVTAASADVLKLTNADGTNTATYEMVIAGSSA